MSRPPKDPTALALLLTAAKDRDGHVPWRVIEAATGIIKNTREGWFRKGPPEPPLGPVCYLAAHLGVQPDDLVAAALKDYLSPSGASSSPSGETPPARPRETADLAAAHAADRGGRRQRRRRKPPSRSQDE